MSEILDTPKDAFKPINHPTTSNVSQKGFVRPEVATMVLDGHALILDEIDLAEPIIPAQEHSTIVTTKATRKKGGKVGPKMPAFGRTQKQVDLFVEHEANRTEELDEEAALKEQRAEERKAKQAEKDTIDAEKKADAKKEQNEIDAIKAKELENNLETPAPLAEKPWNIVVVH